MANKFSVGIETIKCNSEVFSISSGWLSSTGLIYHIVLGIYVCHDRLCIFVISIYKAFDVYV